MGRDWEEWELKEKRMKIEDAPSTRWGRTKARFTSIFDSFTEPLWPELLPGPHPALPQKPYTLLVSIDDLLVTSTWDRQHGWRTAKRPGVDYFLGYLSQFFEVVIFTTQYNYTAAPILDKLDPYQFFISYRLYRDACRSVNGQPVKDLSYLNRDLSKVVVLDVHPEHVSAQPENAIIMPKWSGDPKDRGLIAMIPFLESIGIFKPPDVRPILGAYHGKDIPLEYAKKEAEMKQKHVEEWEHGRKGLPTNSFTLSNLFGGSGQAHSSPIPPTYLEQKRREAQLQYQEEQAYIRANKDNFEKLLKEEQEAMDREMRGGTFWSTMQSMLSGVPPQQPQPKDQAVQNPAGAAAGAAPSQSPSVA
ncbi:NIF-domain-containing protein [Daedalea quercina L-15889]|uniref:Mitochondrial import inner membrane translocase subunit TIM50 n=1 Tax=Daedalea quercina L-15889 TaxID=1314783 RepID=A0A165SRY8_9APHY|nr:NIF-domain-containing protein [Daedalea quercina L-15889]